MASPPQATGSAVPLKLKVNLPLTRKLEQGDNLKSNINPSTSGVTFCWMPPAQRKVSMHVSFGLDSPRVLSLC